MMQSFFYWTELGQAYFLVGILENHFDRQAYFDIVQLAIQKIRYHARSFFKLYRNDRVWNFINKRGMICAMEHRPGVNNSPATNLFPFELIR